VVCTQWWRRHEPSSAGNRTPISQIVASHLTEIFSLRYKASYSVSTNVYDLPHTEFHMVHRLSPSNQKLNSPINFALPPRYFTFYKEMVRTNLLTYLLIPWCRISYEKLIVAQLVKQ
jgi:hypothetical protein